MRMLAPVAFAGFQDRPYGALTLEQDSRRYALSLEELRAWERDFGSYGVHGLRATRFLGWRAWITKAPIGTVRSRLSRGRAELRKLMGVTDRPDQSAEKASVLPRRAA
jgi:hypothetical protein